MTGAIGDQKAVLVFEPDAQCAGTMYEGRFAGSLDEIHAGLLGAGIDNHTLEPTVSGANVYIVDLDGSMADTIDAYADAYDVGLRALG